MCFSTVVGTGAHFVKLEAEKPTNPLKINKTNMETQRVSGSQQSQTSLTSRWWLPFCWMQMLWCWWTTWSKKWSHCSCSLLCWPLETAVEKVNICCGKPTIGAVIRQIFHPSIHGDVNAAVVYFLGTQDANFQNEGFCTLQDSWVK